MAAASCLIVPRIQQNNFKTKLVTVNNLILHKYKKKTKTKNTLIITSYNNSQLPVNVDVGIPLQNYIFPLAVEFINIYVEKSPNIIDCPSAVLTRSCKKQYRIIHHFHGLFGYNPI